MPNDTTVMVVWKCDSREIAVKLMAELMAIRDNVEGAFLETASMDEDWRDWLQSRPAEKER